VVDGTGRPAFRGDVAVTGDRIAAVGDVDGASAQTIEADGRVVSPGFVDVHTHLDAQVAWDPLASSSCWHGVTSVVLGNCGVTFAPCKPEDRTYLAELMESVEDIPAGSILDGLSWRWETYGEYLAELDRLPKGINVGGMVGHCAVRHWAMGERGLDTAPASPDDIAAMTALVDEAIGAGALGFSTSRTMLHRVPDGRAVPGTYATPEELLAIGDVLGRHGRGTFEVAPKFGELDGDDYAGSQAEVGWMADINRSCTHACSSSSTPRQRAARTCGRRRRHAASGCCSGSLTARSSTACRRGRRSSRSTSKRAWPRSTTTSVERS
jgi:N-acyl-D-aspartate/D-glutamate deacylase